MGRHRRVRAVRRPHPVESISTYLPTLLFLAAWLTSTPIVHPVVVR